MADVLLVTGASRGIGAAIARRAARAGYAVAVNYRSERERALALVQALQGEGTRAVAVPGDVAKPDDVERMIDETERALGPLTALVNNAGIVGNASSLIDADPATLRTVLEVDLFGTMLCTRSALRRMARSRGGQGGAIVNISSCAATLGSSGEFVWYAAAKAGVDIFTAGVAREAAPEGVRVNAVAPGMIDTEIHARSGAAERIARITPTVPMARLADPDEVAGPVLYLLSPEASYVSGAVLRIGGGR